MIERNHASSAGTAVDWADVSDFLEFMKLLLSVRLEIIPLSSMMPGGRISKPGLETTMD